LTYQDFCDFQESLSKAFLRASLAEEMGGRWADDPSDSKDRKQAQQLEQARRADIAAMLIDARVAIAHLVEALTGQTDGERVADAILFRLVHENPGDDYPTFRAADEKTVSSALPSLRRLGQLIERALLGLSTAQLSRPKLSHQFMDELIRSAAIMWSRFSGERPPTSPQHSLFRLISIYLRLVGYEAPTAKALSMRWSRIVGPNAVKKKTSAQQDLHKQLLAAEMSFLKYSPVKDNSGNQ
jgi:hypothetical protein